jgi:hypothetical protein
MPSNPLNSPRPPRPRLPRTAPGTLRRRLANPSVLLFVILTAQLMVVLDTTIVNVALPHIQRGLGFSASGLSWVLNAYILTFGGMLLLGARSGDLLGRRRVFLTGIALFTVSSLVGRPGRHRMDAARGAGGARHRRRPGRTLGAVAPHHDLRRRARRGSGPSASTPPCRRPAAPPGSWPEAS